MPFVNGVYQPDPRSPMERLYGFRQKQDELRKMAQQQDMERQRLEILKQSYSPEQAAVAPQYEASAPMRLFGLAGEQPASAPKDLVSMSSGSGAPSPEAPIPQMNMVKPGREATPARFDMQGAIDRLYSIGDLEGAAALENNQYKSALGGRAGAEKWSMTGKTIKGPDGKLYNQVQSSLGNTKLIPLEGDLVGTLQKVDLGGRQVLLNPYDGSVVEDFTVSATPYQQFQMNPKAQADVAGAVEEAKTVSEIKGKEQAAAEGAELVYDKTIGIIDELLKHPGRTAATGTSSMFNVVPGTDAYDFKQKLEQLSGQNFLSEIQRMKGQGALSDSEGKRLEAAAAALDAGRKESGFLGELIKLRDEISFYKQRAQRKKQGGQQPQGGNSQSMNALPPASKHAGRIIVDDQTGVRWKSDGRRWMRIK